MLTEVWAIDEELDYLRSGGEDAVGALFSKYSEKLERMVGFRMDRRLYGRVDTSDVLQDAYMEISRRVEEYLSAPRIPFFVWARQITWQVLLTAHRHHLGAQKRSAEQEQRLGLRFQQNTTSMSIAAHLVSQLTSPSAAAVRNETYSQVHAALEQMDESDREVLALRHFEHLGNNDVAQVLGISVTAASNRYVRALKRLKEIATEYPNIADHQRQ
ncbi:MAG: sigma-70 family RNA polymerase sigma factor [Pirellulales bacterium]|nr:sigma-70 family RNA polymerase sigma factor [Pirellulales bacterium]